MPARPGSSARRSSSSAPGRAGAESPGGLSLALRDVAVSFGSVAALAGLDLEVAAGERVAVVGASGAGKSTLFDVLTRGVPVSRGAVRVDDRELLLLASRELRALRRHIGVVYQSYSLVPQLSVGMNVALGEVGELSNRAALRALLRGPGPKLSARSVAALEALGLADRAEARVADLSGGQQQRVAVARVLVQRPRLILADEPVAAVDPVTAQRVLRALLDLDQDATLLVSLHDVELARRFPRVVALRSGEVAYDGPPSALTEDLLNEIYDGEPLHAEAAEESPSPAHGSGVLGLSRDEYGLRAR